MTSRHGLSVIELLIAVAMVTLIASATLPRAVQASQRAGLAELSTTVDDLVNAEWAHHAARGHWIAADYWSPRETVDRQTVLWPGHHPLNALDWQPTGPLRGHYRVEVTEDRHLAVIGQTDLDEDGQPATWAYEYWRDASGQGHVRFGFEDPGEV